MTLDYEHIRKLAEKRAAASQYVQALGMMNAYGRTPEEQIKASAQYRLASNAAAAADREYQDAMGVLTPDELNELVHEHNKNSI